MGLVSVLAETGVSRRLLHLAAGAGVLGDDRVGAAEVDAGVGDLADASLVGFTVDDESVVAHRLVMRVVRERLAAEGGLPAVLDGAVRVLAGVAGGIGEAWRDPAGVRELAGQVSAVMACLYRPPGCACRGDARRPAAAAAAVGLPAEHARRQHGAGDPGAAEPLAADCERVLGADHPDTLTRLH